MYHAVLAQFFRLALAEEDAADIAIKRRQGVRDDGRTIAGDCG